MKLTCTDLKSGNLKEDISYKCIKRQLLVVHIMKFHNFYRTISQIRTTQT